MDESAPDFDSLPIEERLSHKVWKARLSAYEALINEFKLSTSEDDPCFRPYISNPDLLKKAALDSNAVAQEKAIAALCAFVQYGGKSTVQTRETVMPAVVEKCLGSARAGTKNHALELTLQYTEASGSAEDVVQDIIGSLKAKQPKLVAGCVSALKELMKNFGPKIVPLQLVLKQLPVIFAHADKTVRAEGFALVQETYRFIGPAVEPFLSDLKPVQIKELQESFAALDEKGEGKGTAKQLRMTKDQQREMVIKEAEDTLGGADAADEADAQDEPAAEEFDAHDLLEAVDLRQKTPDGFFEHIASSKWKERKEEALDPLLATLTATPKLSDEDYSDLVAALAKRMTDANVACVTVAAQCIAALANGLRTAFAKYKSTVVPPLLERLKEKKQSVVDALASALDATARTVPLSDLVEDIVAFAAHKNPQVKCETFRFLVRCLKEIKSPPTPTEVQTLSAAQIKGMSDSFEPTRAAAMEGLGTLAKIVGERPLIKELEGLDDIKKAKVKEFMENAQVKSKAGAKPAPSGGRPAPAAASAPAATQPAKPAPRPKVRPLPIETESAPPPSPPPPASRPPPTSVKRPAVSKPAVRAAAAPKKPPAAAAKAPAPKPAAPSAAEPLRYKMSQEEAEAQAESVLPEEPYAGLSNSNWKVRLEAIEGLHTWCQGEEGSSADSELVVRVLSKKPGWKESNFQVFNKVLGLAQMLAEQSPSWSKACSALIIPPASDKLGDIKIKKSSAELLTVLAEKSSLQFVLSQAYEPMTKQKAPKAQAEAIAWIDQALRDFGSTGIAVRDLIEFLKVGLKSSNPAVRTSATKTIVTLKIFIGGAVKDFIQDLNPQLLSTIEKEFVRVEGEAPPEPTRTSADLAAPPVAASGASSKGVGASKAIDPMDELYPRVDLDKILSSSLLSACNDGNWKTRKESMEQVQGLLEANKRYKPGIGGIGAVLKMRLVDSNKVVQNLALDVTSRIASGMNQPFDRHVRILAPVVMQVLSDQKTGTRAAGTATLTAIAEACGVESLVPSAATALETTNPLLRKDLLTWLEAQLRQSDRQLDLAPLVSPLLSCLEDRSAEVRKTASSIIPQLVSSVGYDHVADKAAALKPASRTTVIPLLEAARNSSEPAPATVTSVRSGAASPPPPKKMPLPAQRAMASPTARTVDPSTKPTRPASINPLASSLSRPASAAGKTLRNSAMPSRPLTPSRPASVEPQEAASRPRLGQGLRKPAVAQAAQAPRSPAASTSRAEPPFKTIDSKYKPVRASKEVGPLRWAIDGIARPEQVETLHHQMGPHVNAVLLSQLFSKDHHCEKDFLAALATIDSCAAEPATTANYYSLAESDLVQSLIANLDLIFKYLTIRLADSGTTIVIKCLDIIDHLLIILPEQSFFLSDYEASCLLPSLVNKLGDQKEALRVRVRNIIRQLSQVYPSSKVFAVVLDGTKSKNARTRAESAEELGVLIQRHGENVFQSGKALSALGTLVADRDSAARSAAISTIAIIYNLHGDMIFDYLGSLSSKDRGMLDEKLKRTVAAPPTPNHATAMSAIATPASSRKALRPATSRMSLGGSSGLLPPNSVQKNTSLARPTPSRVADEDAAQVVPSRSQVPRKEPSTQLAPSSLKAKRPTTPPVTFNEIVTDNSASSVDALKTVQKDIDNRANEIMPMADDLVRAVSLQMRTAFDGLDPSTSSATLRLCKHLMQTLSAFFDNRALAKQVSKDALVGLLAELTRRLLETADNATSEAITSLSKVLNMVLIRIFHNSDRSVCFGALFTVLEDVTIDLRELEGRDLQQRAKYAELVMKCLWKISKTAKESLEDGSLQLKKLLVDLDGFLTAIPPAEWRRRAADGVPLGDMPLRTCKTILQQVVTVFGRKSIQELEEMDMSDTSFVGAYLHRLVQGQGQSHPTSAPSARMPTAKSSGTGTPETEAHPMPANNVENTGSNPDDRSINQQLKEIFDAIGQPETSKQGITRLWEFRQAHPEAETRIQSWIDATGKHFKSYLERAMTNISADRGVSTPTSPPPQGQTHSRSGSEVPSLTHKASSTSFSRNSTFNGGTAGRSGATSPRPSTERLANLQSLFGYGAGPNGSS